MPKFILSAFSDEYADDLKEQCEALARFFDLVPLKSANFIDITAKDPQKEADR